METGSLTICLYALFVFSAEGTQVFTGEPKNPFLAVEGDNVTLEWRYSFGKDDSLSQALFEKEKQIVDRYSPSRPPWIKSSYRGRILVNITNDYTLIILLEVKRTDEGNYKFTVVSEKDRERFEKEVEISILYLDQPKINSTDTRPVEGTRVYLSCFVDGKPTPTISWTVNGSPLNTSRNSRVSLRNENKQLTIMNLDRTDSGEYQCVAHSSLRNVSSNSSTLSVQYPPAIALNPLNATKEKGENFTWFCNATGNPGPNISWMFNGSHINIHYNPKIVFSKDKGKMTITNVGRTDSGEYQCMASNNIGNASSQLATFDVLYIPGITAHPDDVTEKEGENATLLCNAVGNPVPKISWNKGGSPLSNNSRVNLSADNKHLTITNVKRVDSGEYRCVATNSLGYVTSYPAYLGVQYKPEISPLPRVIQRMEGEKLTIFCNASGNPLPTISWTKDGNSVDTNNSSRRNLSCEGKQLTVKNVSRGDNGVYRCVAENSLGNVMSHGTTLEVPYIPGVTLIGGPQQFAIVGKIKKLLCEYDAVPPLSEVQWIKDGDVIARNSSLLVNESRISVPYYNESQIQLLINQSTSQDAGNYSCLVINAVGNSFQRTSVISQELPLITTRPEVKTLREGEKITLSCNATGNPEPSISWVKDGSPINGKSRIGLSKDNKRLTITNISRTDSGEYQCVARNRVGNDTSNSRVDVLYKPEIATHPQNITTREGQNVTLCCNATGNPAPTISWYKNGYPINNSFSTIFSPNHEQLTIRNVNRIDRGDYTCRAKNRAGTDTSNASTINVQFRAEIVSHPQVNVIKEEGSNLTLFCNATGNPTPIILWTKDGSPINNNSRIRFSKHNRLLTISNVNRTDSGHYRCVAKNSLGNDTSNVSTVNIQYKPEITSNPKSVEIKEGGNVTFSCNCTANPLPTTSWTKDESPITNDSRISYSVVNKVLTIMNVNRKDSGEYRCVASNKLGNDTSEAAELNVKYRPEITKHPQNVTVAERNNVTLTCNATGNPEPQFSWFKVENTVKSDNRINMSAKTSHLTITDVNRHDSGGYLCVAHNELGNDTSIIVILDVQYKPEIATHPHNIRTREGQNVTIYCNATGNPVPTISWYKNEYPISNGFRIILSPGYERLTIRNVNRIDSGNYTCLGSNSVGADTSDASTINVQFRAEIVYHPQTTVIKEEGSDLTLFCNATGNPIPIILWTKDGSPINNNSRIRFSIHNMLLTISNVNRTDSSHYRCVAKNSLGNDTSNVATVDIQYKPEITILPKSRDIEEGGNVTFSCNSTANPLPTTSWTKDESPITSNSRISYSVVNKVLMITNVNGNDSGEYRCVASNKLGNDTSKAAKLNVKYEPEIITDPSDDKVKEGQNTTLYCNATGNPLPAISWKKDGHSIGNNSRISYSAESNELRIINVYRTDRGKYHCVANNSIGNASSHAATLAVEYKSKITTHPSNVTKTEGENVTLHCNATGYPLPTLSWTKDGSDISSNSRISFSADKKQLAITKANRVDSGAYRCVANNSLGNDASMAAVVDVQFAPEISIHPRNVTIVRGDSVTFSCSVVGNPTPSVVWEKDRKDLNVTGNSRFNLSSRNNNHSLEIAEVHSSDSGQYRCVAENSKNISYSSAATLTVQYVPDPPEDVKVISRASREVNVSWTAGSNGNSAIQNYTVEIREDKQTFRDAICQGTLLKNNCVIYSTRVSIKELLPWTTYYLRVFARNMIGPGNYSSVVNVTTEEEVPSSAPPFNVTVFNSTAVNVSWQEDARGDILGYYILYKRKSEPEASWKNKTVDRAETTSLVLASLDEYTSYQFAIQAFNRKGVSGRSEIVERETDEVVPEPPQNITVITKGSRAINISWTAGFDGNSAIGNYTVEISEHDQIFKDVICQGSLSSSACVVSSLSTTASLTGLFPWTIYNIRVFARNKIGRSNSSPILNVTTDEAEPSRGAENVSFSEVNYTTNRITWAELPKEAANGVIKLYEVRLELKESCLKVDFTFHAMNTTKSSLVLAGFWMCAKYKVSVRGYTVAGPGPYGKAVVVQTKSLKLSQTWSKETPSPPSFSKTPSGEGITANITLPRFPGNAKFFQVIVIRYSLDYTGVVNSPESLTPKDLMTYEEAHKSPVPAAYVTFQFRGQDFNAFREFVVGDGGHSSSKTRNRRSNDGEVFLNKPLQPNTKYRVFLRAFIEKMVYFSSNFVTIETKGKPAVKELPERTIFQVGDVVVLTCEATGDPKPSVTWSKDENTSIPRAQFRNDNHILVIQEVAPGDGGIYECRVSNSFGQRRTATAVVIAVPPSIMKDFSPRSVLCAKETPCSLLCHAISDILFNYSWTRNGQALDGHNIKVMNNSVIITPLDDQDFGDYVCHATNSFGSTSYKIALSESREEGNNVQSFFRASDIAWSCIVFVLLFFIGVYGGLKELRRATDQRLLRNPPVEILSSLSFCLSSMRQNQGHIWSYAPGLRKDKHESPLNANPYKGAT